MRLPTEGGSFAHDTHKVDFYFPSFLCTCVLEKRSSWLQAERGEGMREGEQLTKPALGLPVSWLNRVRGIMAWIPDPAWTDL